jgi:hypothetical protein
MGARKKLNQSYLNGILIIAGVVGAATQSWIVFGIAAAALAVGSLHSGDIRLGKGDDRR